MTTILSIEEWSRQWDLHRAELSSFCAAHRERRSRKVPHPVYDFLFTYYSASSSEIELWHPGALYSLEDDASNRIEVLLRTQNYSRIDGLVSLNPCCRDTRTLRRARSLYDLNRAIATREERYSCFGLHEWAMVYREGTPRHSIPLRFSPSELQKIVERETIACSHYDAFRFFTPSAQPRNTLSLRSEERHALDQGGCIHVTMDLYKWCYKLSPLISSTLLRRAFFLAKEAREIDMRASPYDLTSFGFTPIQIETEEGKREYVTLQRGLAEKGRALRFEFLHALHPLIEDTSSC
jgi:hypothetical protein